MTTRAGNIGTFVSERGRRGSALRIVVILSIVTVLMLYVGGKVQFYRLGYKIHTLEQEKKDLERSNRSLRIEASSLSSPARIEDIAVKRLGMVRPAKENIVMVKRKTLPKR